MEKEEETVRFYENLSAIDDLLKETEADFQAISGLYDDAGVWIPGTGLHSSTG